MKRFGRVGLIIFSVCCLTYYGYADPKLVEPHPDPDAWSSRPEELIEFSGEDIRAALGKLAKMARVSLILTDEVQGKVAARIKNRTALDAIKIIVDAKGFTLDELPHGVYRVDVKKTAPPKELEFYASLIEFQSRPETAKKLAEAKRRLYEALIVAGFTKDEALLIVLHERESGHVTK